MAVEASRHEYLDKSGLWAYLKDVVTLLLENRPDEPVDAIADYFRHILQGSSPMLRAHRFIRLARPGAPSFADNLLAAYCALDPVPSAREVVGLRLPQVAVALYKRLINLLCADLPVDVALVVLTSLGSGAREDDVVNFAQFRAGVEACLLHETLFEECELLHADVHYEAMRSGISPRACAIAVLDQLLGTGGVAHAALGAACGALALSPDALKAALQRARTHGEGMELARSVLERAEHVSSGERSRALSVNGDERGELTRETFARAVFGAVGASSASGHGARG
ncbi:hypothetical protein KFE25_014362 [Diacronema lutheri]|nr:hypothetical protein KFE25_014362 [Diacronema lutheri]